MSEIREQMTAEIKAAMKAKQTDRLATLRMIKAEILKKETEKGASDIDEAGMIKLLQSMKKQREDSIAMYEKGGRPELAAKEQAEIEVIETFLPKQLGDDELNAIVEAAIAELGVADMKGMGKVIKEVVSRVAGGADGKRVSTAVKAKLSS